MPIDLPGYLCDPTGARAELTLDAGTASYPRGVLRGERPKRVLVPFARSKGTPSGKRPHQAGKPELGPLEEQPLSLLRRQLPLHRGALIQGRLWPGANRNIAAFLVLLGIGGHRKVSGETFHKTTERPTTHGIQ